MLMICDDESVQKSPAEMAADPEGTQRGPGDL